MSIRSRLSRSVAALGLAAMACFGELPAGSAAELVVHGTGGDDRFLLQLDPATGRVVEVSRDGILVETMALAELDRVTINGLLGDDLVEVDYGNGFFDVPTLVNGGGHSTPSGDALWVTGAGSSVGSTVYALGGVDPEGKSGTLFRHSGARVHEIRFTGLEPICYLTAGTLTINATASSDYITVSTGPSCGPDPTYKVDFNGASEEIYFRNKTALTINAGLGDDLLTLDLPARVDTALASIVFNGDDGQDTIRILDAPAGLTVSATTGAQNNAFFVSATNASLLDLAGGGGSDSFVLGNAGSLSDLNGPIAIHGDGHDAAPTTSLTIGGLSNTLPSGDTVTLFDLAYADNYISATLGASSFGRDGMAGSLTFDTIESLHYYAGTGSTTVTVDGTGASTNTEILTQNGPDSVIVTATGVGSNLRVTTQGGNDTAMVWNAAGFVVADGGVESDLLDYQGTPTALFPESATDGFVVPSAGVRVSYQNFEFAQGEFLFDFGDAPDPTFSTRLATDGARHAGDGTLRLGVAWDGELEGQADGAASGDGGDEDGVSFTSVIEIGPDSTGADLDVTSAGFGKLDAWIDFNADGDFVDSGEQVFVNAAVTGTANKSFTSFAERQPGATFGRFRLSSTGGLGPGGLATDGEVEDYALTLTPPLDLDLFNRVDSGPRTFWACHSISAGDPSGYEVVSGEVAFEAGSSIVLRDGFSVATGASFSAILGPIPGCAP